MGVLDKVSNDSKDSNDLKVIEKHAAVEGSNGSSPVCIMLIPRKGKKKNILKKSVEKFAGIKFSI